MKENAQNYIKTDSINKTLENQPTSHLKLSIKYYCRFKLSSLITTKNV